MRAGRAPPFIPLSLFQEAQNTTDWLIQEEGGMQLLEKYLSESHANALPHRMIAKQHYEERPSSSLCSPWKSNRRNSCSPTKTNKIHRWRWWSYSRYSVYTPRQPSTLETRK